MRRNDIQRVLKSGSVRQKIKLYLTDIALLQVDLNNLDYDTKGGGLNIKGTTLLSSKERDLLWESIKEPKDIRYYNDLLKWNKSFLFWKDKLSLNIAKLQSCHHLIYIEYKEDIERHKGRDLVNDLLDLYPDEKSRKAALKHALKETKRDGGKVYQEEGYPQYLDFEPSMRWDEIKRYTEMARQYSTYCKSLIDMNKIILSKKLPLQPYRDWNKAQEKRLKKTIEAIRDLTLLDEMPKDLPRMESYEEIGGGEFTAEDIEDFKTAGL